MVPKAWRDNSTIFAFVMESTFKHSKTYRFETINNHANVKTVLYVLHGYGHLAKYFIQKFAHLSEDLMIVAPEGMHRFYLKGASGRVGASWMTKEIREVDIADNINWLDALDDEISKSHTIERRILLGFSQGGSTAIRWNIHGKVKFDALIVWASDFPPEEKENTEQLIDNQSHFIIGSNDEFYDSKGQEQLIDYYKSIGFKISTYIGTHDIHGDTLLKAINLLHT